MGQRRRCMCMICSIPFQTTMTMNQAKRHNIHLMLVVAPRRDMNREWLASITMVLLSMTMMRETAVPLATTNWSYVQMFGGGKTRNPSDDTLEICTFLALLLSFNCSKNQNEIDSEH
eukprot:m.218161 g.218161  ORF g.218161 m.218161 type:complete len:117 (+) comp39890_c1_seq1:610-960(+)